MLWTVALIPGFVLALPLVFTTKYVSELKRKEALAGSKVKIDGRDVVATWKVRLTRAVAVAVAVPPTFWGLASAGD